MLYFRQILIMLVSLYTVRVVLETLGAEDYGIYNVVAGVVVLFSFLNGAMTSATQRFLNYALGQNNIEQARDVYSISYLIHVFIAILVAILTETVGLWFFRTRLNIPSDRRIAAFFVYQISISVTMINIIRVPYNATIIAYERMSFFAWISIVECVLKLSVVFLITAIPFDSLILYAILVCVVGLIIFFVHKFYCNKNFEIANFRHCKNKKLSKSLISFSGWGILGDVANMSQTQGVNILINIYSGVTVNAAQGIAVQINSAIYQLVSNFQTAFNPQIVKSYAAKDYEYFINLTLQTSRISFYILYIFVLPLYINIDFVLMIWLKNVPEYTAEFVRLILIFSLIDSISGPLKTSIVATGEIKNIKL
jgi:O-antigen/teichoic acid export membrane protein